MTVLECSLGCGQIGALVLCFGGRAWSEDVTFHVWGDFRGSMGKTVVSWVPGKTRGRVHGQQECSVSWDGAWDIEP